MKVSEVRELAQGEQGVVVTRTETCSVAAARRVAAMLDLDPDIVMEGASLPRGWQFILMGADTRRSSLRADGFPGLGVVMPDLGLPRLLLGNRNASFAKDISIGATVERTSSIQSLRRKNTETGPMAVATILHELRLPGDLTPCLIETQTYLLLPARKGAATTSAASRVDKIEAEHTKNFTPDETLLFQYSALGFNTHRIHIDRSHARNVEGFPDLVVNGGLGTLLLTEFLRNELKVTPTGFRARHVAPLFCSRPLTISAEREGDGWRLKAYDDRKVLAIDMEVEVQ